METYLVKFQDYEWEKPAAGVRSKAFINGSQRIRLVEFSEGFQEEGWCTNGHAGYVLEGSFSLEFQNDTKESFFAGHTFFIPSGTNYGHKVIIKENEKVLLLLFEIITS